MLAALAAPPPAASSAPSLAALSLAPEAAYPPPRAPFFDYIDLSNVADYVSLPALVQAAAPWLRPCAGAGAGAAAGLGWAAAAAPRLRCESIVAFGRAARAAPALLRAPAGFVDAARLGVPLDLFQRLLGLRLVSAAALPGWEAAVRLEWGPLEEGAGGGGGGPVGSGGAAMDGGSKAGGGGAGGGGAGGGSLPGPVTAGLLLLELLAAAKRLVVPYAATGAAAAPPAGPSEWESSGAPATLAHLMALAAPGHADALLQAAVRSEPTGLARLFKWWGDGRPPSSASGPSFPHLPPAHPESVAW